MKPPFLLVAALAFLLLLPSNSVIAKNVSVGIYGIVDQVTFEPAGNSPNFIRTSGVFVVPVTLSSGSYHGEVTFISGLHSGPGRPLEGIGANSRALQDQTRWLDLDSIGSRTQTTRRAIHTIHLKSAYTRRVAVLPHQICTRHLVEKLELMTERQNSPCLGKSCGPVSRTLPG
jgi:hypothetical protein